MTKNFKRFIVYFLVSSILIIVFAFSNKEYNNKTINNIDISILYYNKDTLITAQEIKNTVENIITNRKIFQVDPGLIELRCMNIPWVKSAEVFITLDGNILINVVQRNPLLRIWKNNEQSIYLDYSGFFPLKEDRSTRVINVSGYIPAKEFILQPPAKDSVKNTDLHQNMFYELLNLANYIYKDDFLNAITEQFYIQPDKEICIEPKIFNHTVLFGKIENIEEKFVKLKTLYSYLFEKNEINKYKLINLSYKDQAVCTKK